MVHFGKVDVTSKVLDPSFANFDYGKSSFLVATDLLPIFIKEDPASRWQNLPLCEGLRPYAGGGPFVSSQFGLEVDRTTCMPSEQ